MEKTAILEKVFEVYGPELPSKNLYNASKASPTSVRVILAKYKTWSKFEKEYTEMCIVKRNDEAKKKVVTKAPAKKEDKDV